MSLFEDKRLNEQTIKLLSYDIEMLYDKVESTQIDLADFISRSEHLLRNCDENCRVCRQEDHLIEIDIVNMETEPLVNFEEFERIYRLYII